MSARTASWLAWSLCALILLLLASSVLLIVLGWSTPLPGAWVPWRDQAVFLVGVVGAPILGGLIASRRPENPYGWLWLGFGFGAALLGFAQCYAAYALEVAPGSLPASRTVGTVVAGVGFVTVITLVPLLSLLFPTGRPPSRRWRFLVWIVVILGMTLLIVVPFVPGPSEFAPIQNPLGVEGTAGETVSTVVGEAVVPILFLTEVPAVLSLVIRYRRATGVERQQIKWFAYAAVLFSSPVVPDLLGIRLPEVWDNILTAVAVTVLSVAIGIAILKYRLYDIDLIINRTLVYGSLTALLALLYFGGVVLVQGIGNVIFQMPFRALAGQESQLAIVASTLAIAALFNPLRRRLQAFVDRRFYRRKYDAAKTLAAFSAKLRDETDLEDLTGDLVGVVRETMQPEHVSVWLREPEERR